MFGMSSEEKQNKPFKMFNNTETVMIKKQGWELNKIFAEKIADADKTYSSAVEHAKTLSKTSRVALRSVSNSNYHYIDVYKRKDK